MLESQTDLEEPPKNLLLCKVMAFFVGFSNPLREIPAGSELHDYA
jgi:hypothetical protein